MRYRFWKLANKLGIHSNFEIVCYERLVQALTKDRRELQLRIVTLEKQVEYLRTTGKENASSLKETTWLLQQLSERGRS